MRLPLALSAALLALALAAPAGALASGDAEDRIVIVGPVEVARGETVGTIAIADGRVEVAGTVSEDVLIANGPLTVVAGGLVEGDLFAAAGQITLERGAEVRGDVNYGDEEPRIAPGAAVGGEVSHRGWDDLDAGLPLALAGFAIWLAFTISSLALGMLLLALAPRAAEAVFETARQSVGMAVGAGIAVFIGLPGIAILATATLLGLPLGLAVLAGMVPLLAIAYVTAAWALGRALVRPPGSPFLAFFAGWAILRAVALVPVLGIVAWLAAVILGLGLLTVALFEARKAPAEPAAA